MAMSGTITTSPAISGDTFQLRWSATRNGRQATIAWNIYKTTSGYVYVGPVRVTMDGTQRYNYTGHRTYKWDGKTTMTTGSFVVNYNADGSRSIPLLFQVGALNNAAGKFNTTATGTASLDNIGYEAPIISSIGSSSIARTSVVLTAVYDLKGAAITSSSWELSTNGGTAWMSYGAALSGGSITGLIPNTLYTYRAKLTTAGGSVTKGNSTFTTTGNAPVVISIEETDITINSVKIDADISYDTKSTFASIEIQYGTTTSYGTTTTANPITGLIPDTLYYYRYKVIDNWGRASSWQTGQFATLADSYVRLIYGDGTITETKKMFLIQSDGTKTEVTKKIFNIIT